MVAIEEGNEGRDEGEDMEFGEMDLQGIVDACVRWETNSIPEKQIHHLQTTLRKSKDKFFIASRGKRTTSSSLAIKNVISKESPKLAKEEKKRGRWSNKQLLQELGEFLINLGRITLTTEKFQATPPNT